MTVVHQVGEDDIVAQLAVGNAYFWVANTDPGTGRFSAAVIGGGTSRTLLVTGDPDNMVSAAHAVGVTMTSPVNSEHGWRLGCITDPGGHYWEIATPTGSWPPSTTEHCATNGALSRRSG